MPADQINLDQPRNNDTLTGSSAPPNRTVRWLVGANRSSRSVSRHRQRSRPRHHRRRRRPTSGSCEVQNSSGRSVPSGPVPLRGGPRPARCPSSRASTPSTDSPPAATPRTWTTSRSSRATWSSSASTCSNPATSDARSTPHRPGTCSPTASTAPRSATSATAGCVPTRAPASPPSPGRHQQRHRVGPARHRGHRPRHFGHLHLHRDDPGGDKRRQRPGRHGLGALLRHRHQRPRRDQHVLPGRQRRHHHAPPPTRTPRPPATQSDVFLAPVGRHQGSARPSTSRATSAANRRRARDRPRPPSANRSPTPSAPPCRATPPSTTVSSADPLPGRPLVIGGTRRRPATGLPAGVDLRPGDRHR